MQLLRYLKLDIPLLCFSLFFFFKGSGVETIKGRAIKADEFGITTEEEIFAGGDCVRGAAFAVDAIADGNFLTFDRKLFYTATFDI